MPCAFGDTAEMIELCKVTAKYDGILWCISAVKLTILSTQPGTD
jgi:hypothetical protein